MNRIIRNRNGSVSVFLVIVVMIMFFFNAVLIDFARIMVANRQLELSVRSGVRSVMAPYDRKLQEDYGLFGSVLSKVQAEDIFNTVLKDTLTRDTKYFRFVDFQLEEKGKVEFEGLLGHDSVFRQHVLEEMKYKILLVLMKSIKDALEEEGAEPKKLDDMDNLIDVSETIKKNMKNLSKELKEVTNAISDTQTKTNDFLASIKADNEGKYSYDTGKLEAFNKSISTLEHKIRTAESTVSFIRITLRDNGLEAGDYIETTATLLAETKSSSQNLKSQVDNIAGLIDDQDNQPGMTVNKSPVSSALKELVDKIGPINDNKTELDNKINMADLAEEEAKGHFNTFDADSQDDDIKDDSEAYKKLREYFKSYYGSDTEEDKSQYQRSSSTTSFAKHALNFIKDMAEGAMEEIIINEYGPTKFNYRTYGKDKSNSLDEVPSYTKLEKQEMEFIIYGFYNAYLNIGAAYLEIFLIRLVVHLIENVRSIEPFTLLAQVALSFSLAVKDMVLLTKGQEVVFSKYLKSLKLSYLDYLRFLCGYRAIIPSWQEKRNARMQALIHLNTGKDLNKRPVYVKGTAEATIRLWFIPGVIKALNYTGVLDGQVEGNRYKISKTAYATY